MFEDPNSFGPHYAPGLIGADGKLSRLCKGGGPPAPTAAPPPVRETSPDVQQSNDAERMKASKRRGYNQSLLGGGDPNSQPGSKSLLG